MYRYVVGDLVFMKKARQSGEFVVQRMFVQAAANECAAVLCEFERVWDKTAATHFECYRRRSIMKSGILVEAFVCDGALHSSCDRLHRQDMAAYHHSLEADAELQHGDCLLHDLTHWHVSAWCVFHLAHGGLKREASEVTKDKFLLRSAVGWPGLLLDSGPTAFRRLTPAFLGRLVAGSWCAQ